MECFLVYAAFAFMFLQYLTVKKERDFYRAGYWRVIDQWTESVRGRFEEKKR